MMAGRIDYLQAPIAVALPFVREGKLVALAVNTPARLPAIPDVPTLSESGFENAGYSFWIAFFAPAKVSRAIVERLAFETRKALAEPKVREKLDALSIEPIDMTPEALDALLAKQIATDAELVHAAGLGAKHRTVR